MIVNDGHGAYLTSDKDYGDIELLVDFKIGPKGDSGVYLRGTPQVQIWDFTEPSYAHGSRQGLGRLLEQQRRRTGKDPWSMADKPIGEWNTFRIIQVGAGPRSTQRQAGRGPRALEELLESPLPLPARGPIQLQTHDHEIHWRNIAVREIPPDEANQILAKHGAEGFRSIFNGQNLAEWAGPIENYEVKDGILQCKPHKGGTIYLQQRAHRLRRPGRVQATPRGNNGLAIRIPARATPPMTACASSRSSTTAPPSTPSARPPPSPRLGLRHGRRPRGYLRPVGQWNFEEVTVKGSKIKVELNGTVILDTDLSKVKEYMANSAHPGKDRTSGSSASPATATRSSSATYRSRPWIEAPQTV